MGSQGKRQPDEDNLKYENDLKNEDNLKNEDDVKYEDNLKNEDDLKMKTTSTRTTWSHQRAYRVNQWGI